MGDKQERQKDDQKGCESSRQSFRGFSGYERLKVPKCEIFHLFDFKDFYGIKSL
jgi:hypothetical protein